MSESETTLGHEIVIKSNGKTTEVYLDGLKVDGVSSVKFEHEVGNLASMNLTLFVIQKGNDVGGDKNG